MEAGYTQSIRGTRSARRRLEQSQEYQDFIAGYPSLSAIGNTPMVRLDLPLDTGEADIHAKYEHLNPAGR